MRGTCKSLRRHHMTPLSISGGIERTADKVGSVTTGMPEGRGGGDSGLVLVYPRRGNATHRFLVLMVP